MDFAIFDMDWNHIGMNNDSGTGVLHNSTENVTRTETLEELRIDYLLLPIMVSVLSIVGILGNVPVLIVYFRRKDKKASNTFIKVLAFVDLLVCCGVMPYTIVYEYHLLSSDFLCRFFELLRHFVVSASNITLVAIAGERYIAVCQIGTKINVKWINRGVIAIMFLSLIMAAPSVGVFAVVKVTDVADIPCSFPHSNPSFCHFTYNIMGKMAVMAFQGFQMIAFFLIFFVIVVLYTIVYVVLWKKTKIHKKLTSSQISESLPRVVEKESLVSQSKQTQTDKNDILNNDDESSTSDRGDCFPAERHCCSSSSTGNSNTDSSQSKQDSKDFLFTECPKIETKVSFQMTAQANMMACVVASNDNVIASLNSSPTKNGCNRYRFSFCQVQKPKKKRGYHRRTARMLFLCTIIYFVTWLPFWLDIFQITNSLLLRYMFFVGNASNPIVYGIVNRQVRMSLKRLILGMFRRCGKGEKTSQETAYNCSTSGVTDP